MSTTAVDEIRQELSVLCSRVDAVEARLAQNGDTRMDVPDLPQGLLDRVREITQDIFPGKCEFTREFDPEYPEDQYVVAIVEATGAIKEIVDRECVWHERMQELSSDLFRNLRLSVVPI
jgi:hypothetical protein